MVTQNVSTVSVMGVEIVQKLQYLYYANLIKTSEEYPYCWKLKTVGGDLYLAFVDDEREFVMYGKFIRPDKMNHHLDKVFRENYNGYTGTYIFKYPKKHEDVNSILKHIKEVFTTLLT